MSAACTHAARTPAGSLPGPSRTITVEPLRVPVHLPPAPSPRPPERPAREREPAREPAPARGA